MALQSQPVAMETVCGGPLKEHGIAGADTHRLGTGRKLHGALRAALIEHAPTTPTVMLQNKNDRQIERGEVDPLSQGGKKGGGRGREREGGRLTLYPWPCCVK